MLVSCPAGKLTAVACAAKTVAHDAVDMSLLFLCVCALRQKPCNVAHCKPHLMCPDKLESIMMSP